MDALLLVLLGLAALIGIGLALIFVPKKAGIAGAIGFFLFLFGFLGAGLVGLVTITVLTVRAFSGG